MGRIAPRPEFMSPPWIAMARREITSALEGRDLEIEPFTLSEEFTDPPAHRRDGSDRVGFSARVGAGRVEIGDGPAPARTSTSSATTPTGWRWPATRMPPPPTRPRRRGGSPRSA